MLSYQISVFFNKGYIANPYWPEIAKLIDIQKQSGMNRAKSAANRRKALEEHLRAAGLTLRHYESLERDAQRPFYMDGEEIIIPENSVLSFLVATCDESRAAQRPCGPEHVRSRFSVSPWRTGKREADGLWERFATVSSGTGQKLSNQRGFRSNAYIKEFEAEGTISFDPEFVDAKTLKNAIAWGGQFVGIGASRKMGWGRFELRDFAATQPTND